MSALARGLRAAANRPLMLLPSRFQAYAYDEPHPELVEAQVLARVAIIPVRGSLGSDWWSDARYGDIRVGFLAIAADDVDAVVLDVDSPGGGAEGCFDLVDTIYAARGSKPIWAILSESAYSAAYALASAADRVIVPRTGGTGSIGVI